ncbi:hypothetical protein [Streptomyces sp. NBC_01262]|uniref:hypothetical protein n=1 Tax=Streptomyces sp. NBC_01262 TaxID=2903803 RepID=UPI002E331B48|nr:hypothetical protein [Streptomyces sp. NBC_01262]
MPINGVAQGTRGWSTGVNAVGAGPVVASASVPLARRSGLFGRRSKDESSELAELHAWITRTQGLDAAQVADLMRQVRAEAAALREQAEEEAEGIRKDAREVAKEVLDDARKTAKETERARKDAEKRRREIFEAGTRLAELQARIVTTDETAMLQQVGIYAYRHQLQDAVAYRSRLETLQTEIKNLARADRAVLASTKPNCTRSSRHARSTVSTVARSSSTSALQR